MTTNQQGNITECLILLELNKKGCSVSIPFGSKERYDQIWDIKGILYKVQIKTSRWYNENQDAIIFNCYSVSNGKKKTYTKKEIDLFATIWNDVLYIVPVEECGTQKILRFFSKQSNQPNISWAENYTFEKIFGTTAMVT